MVEYRPFYILGDVAESGKYPFVPRLNVMKAVSLAKGFRRKTAANDNFAQQLANLRARQALSTNIVALASARVRLARVLAEQAEKNSFDYTPDQQALTKVAELGAMVEEERNLFPETQESA